MSRNLFILAASLATTALAAQSAYYQCGGTNWTGETTCIEGFYCKVQNPYYSQCVEGTSSAAATTTVVATTSVASTVAKPEISSSSSATATSVKTTVAKPTTIAKPTTTAQATSVKPTTTAQATTNVKPVTTAKAPTTLSTSIKAAISSSSSAAAPSGSAGAVTGAPGDGTSGTGVTTRYWDCCKPSCAWPGKAAVTGPVGTCDATGNVLTDANAASGCSGGNSFMCADQSPWAVSDSLAYGFAAVNIAGGTESSWCCSCYALTFTSGNAIGKKMIVQATNTGGDLGSNQFDIAMPGGGVGLFNGCATQYSSSWGSTYGGVSSVSECSALPSALQPGCDWRFDWFEGSDNPTVSWESVQCPAELVAKTGCART